MKNLSCLCCGNNDVKSVPGVVGEGSWDANTFGVGIDSSFDIGYGVARTSGASALAQQLSAPPRPDYSIWQTLGCLILMAPPLLIFLIGLFREDPIYYVAAFLTLGPVAAFAIWTTGRLKVRIAQWEEGMSVWSRLLYCARCNSVTDPGPETWLPVASARRLIRR